MINRYYLKYFFPIFFLLILSSCAYDKRVYDFSMGRTINEIFISMPENNLVFDNVSPYLYENLVQRYSLLGYKIKSTNLDSYHLKSKILSLRPFYKGVSPDLLIYSRKLKVEIFCELFDIKGNLVSSKKFLFFRFVPEPKNPILSSNFFDFAYTKIFSRASRDIEHYFRKYLEK